jgi:hypothetical protein
MPSTQQKKEVVRKLLLQNRYTWAEIMKMAHVGPNLVSSVQKEIDQVNNPSPRSNRSRAFELFENQEPKGVNLMNVMKELDIDINDAKKYQIQFFEAKSHEEIAGLLHNEELVSMLPLIRKIYTRHLTFDAIENAIRLTDILPNLEARYLELSRYEASARRDIIRLDDEVNSFLRESERLKMETSSLAQSKVILQQEVEHLERLSTRLKNEKDFESIKNIARAVGESILNHRRTLVAVAGASVLQTFGEDLNRTQIFSNPAATKIFISSLLDPGPEGSENQMFKDITKYVENFSDLLFRLILGGVVNIVGDLKEANKGEKMIEEVSRMITLYEYSPYFARLLNPA